MASTYARRFADSGYTAFVFDFAGFGESRGDPRQAEIPSGKITDIAAAVSSCAPWRSWILIASDARHLR